MRSRATALLALLALLLVQVLLPAAALADADALVKSGDAALAKGRYKHAFAEYDRALKEDPDNSSALAGRGMAAFQLRKYARSKDDLERALKLDPSREDGRNELAWIYFYYGDEKASRAMLKKAEKTGDTDQNDKLLVSVIDGPFKKRFGALAPKLTGRSKSGHYRLTTDLGAAPGREIAGDHTRQWHLAADLLDRVYSAYAKEFPFPKDEKIVFNVILCKKEKDYERLEKLMGGKPGQTAGMYSATLKTLCVLDDAETGEGLVAGLHAETVDTIFHEGLHQFVDFYIEDAPPWFDEGLGEYFGPTTIDANGALHFGNPSPARLEVVRDALKRKGAQAVVPLRDFLSMGQERFCDPDRAELDYSEAWAFMHYLRSSAEGRAILAKYLEALKAGKGAKGAFEAAFSGADLEALERGWKEHVAGL